MTILVVDDNVELAETLAEILKWEFPAHELDVGANGAHALDLASVRRPHVVIMDLEMPILGGVDAAHEMRRRMPQPPKLTLIAMSGNPAALHSDSTRKPFDYLLQKPLDFDYLIRLIAAA